MYDHENPGIGLKKIAKNQPNNVNGENHFMAHVKRYGIIKWKVWNINRKAKSVATYHNSFCTGRIVFGDLLFPSCLVRQRILKLFKKQKEKELFYFSPPTYSLCENDWHGDWLIDPIVHWLLTLAWNPSA